MKTNVSNFYRIKLTIPKKRNKFWSKKLSVTFAIIIYFALT